MEETETSASASVGEGIAAGSGTKQTTTAECTPYDNWDPMGDVSKELNALTNFGGQGDPYGIISGGIPGSHRLPREQTPCKFYKYDSKFDTCGRAGCRYLHARTKYVEPLIQEEIILSYELQSKTSADPGLINIGVVVAITDPWDFCIVPFSDWICLCQLKYAGEEREETYGWELRNGQECGERIPNAGVANLLRLFEDFRQFDRIRSLPKNVACVNTNQVVAVHLPTIGEKSRKEWFRAVVHEDEVLGESNTVSLSLVDFGTSIEADFNQLSLLPRKLLRYPPLGYRCSLNGVSPVSHRWSRRAQSLFSDFVYGKVCIFQLIKPSYPDDGVFETVPNVVELNVCVDGHYVNLSKELISNGMGIGWNPFPRNTDLLNIIPENEVRAVSNLLTHTSCCPSRSNIMSPTNTNTEGRSPMEYLSWVFNQSNNLITPIGKGTYPGNSSKECQIPSTVFVAGSSHSTGYSGIPSNFTLPLLSSYAAKNFMRSSESQQLYQFKEDKDGNFSTSTSWSSQARNTNAGTESQRRIPNEASLFTPETASKAAQKPRKGKTKWKPLQL